jgi:hypothetical protein
MRIEYAASTATLVENAAYILVPLGAFLCSFLCSVVQFLHTIGLSLSAFFSIVSCVVIVSQRCGLHAAAAGGASG